MRGVAALAVALLWLGGARAAPMLSHLEVVWLHDGINTIPRFAADGRPATIVQGWRDNGNAHGHFVWLVTLPRRGESAAGVVAFDTDAGLEDTIAASPFDGERVLQTVRFARARVDGTPATVAIRADLGESASGVWADHAPAQVKIYRLESPGVSVGATPDVFRLIESIEAPGLFCNADMALRATLQLPLPAGYAGGKSPDGCL